MRAHLRSLFLSAILLLCGWPAMLAAYVPAQLPQASAPPSFMLVASRKLADQRFRETVIVITYRSHFGPIGVVVNQPRDVTLDKVFPDYPAAREMTLFLGGPVNLGQLSYLVRDGEAVAGTLKLAERLYLANSGNLLGQLLSGARSHNGLRVVTGMAAWAPGQLEREIERGDWHTLPIDEAAIFELPAGELWQALYRRANPQP